MYERGDSISDIAKAVNHGEKGIYNKVCLMGYKRKVFDKHDVRMAAIYKDKDWCFDRYINQQKTFDEMATEAHCSKRVIQKWCADVYGYNMHTYRHYAKLKPTEREIVMAGTDISPKEISPFILKHTQRTRRTICSGSSLNFQRSVLRSPSIHLPKSKRLTAKIIYAKHPIGCRAVFWMSLRKSVICQSLILSIHFQNWASHCTS